MTTRPILEIPVDDAKFQTFLGTFQKYQKALKETPDLWKDAGASMGEATDIGLTLAAAIFAQAEAAKAMAAEQKRIADEERKRRKTEEESRITWGKMTASAKSFAGHVKDATVTLFKWSSIGTIGAGLLGAGGLFGLDSLAGNVAAGRRSSLGLNVPYGAQKAFGVDYGRLVNAGSVLSGVNDALTDVSKRYALYGAGLREADISGKNTGQVANALLPAIERLVDRTPRQFLSQLQQSRGLGLLGLSVEDLQRIKDTPASERRDLARSFGLDQGAFGLPPDVQKKYQDFSTQLSRAGTVIETAFIRGIVPLIPGLTSLSGSVAKAVTTFLGSFGPNGEKLKDLGDGIETFAKYIGSKEFQDDVKNFADDVGYASKKIADGLKWLGLIPDRKDPDRPSVGDRAAGAAKLALGGAVAGAVVGGALGGPGGALLGGRIGFWAGGAAGAVLPNGVRVLGERAYGVGSPNWTNPGNLRLPGHSTGYARFDNPESGIRAVSRQLGLYEGRDRLDTIAKIVAKYAPSNDHNNVAAYIKDVVSRTGIGANQHLNLNDANVLAKVVSAILQHENIRQNKKYTPQTVLKILNNTGGNVTLQTAAAAGQ